MSKKSWIKPHHKTVRNIANVLFGPIVKLKYNVRPEKFDVSGKKAYLILYNHQTPFDQFFVGISFDLPIYYVATEDIFSNGLVSDLIRGLVAPIPIAKGTNDAGSILKCIRVAREGGTLAIAPEGNRTYSGRTEHISESVIPLARKLGLPVLLYRIEGGYGKNPRWSDKVRGGKMRAYVHSVITPEEYREMTDEEFFSAVKEGLYVDENRDTGVYRSNRRAEYLERAIYYCPFCGLSEFESKRNKAVCKKCGRAVEYGADKKLRGVGFDFPYGYFGEWYDAQNEFVRSLNTDGYLASPLYRDKADVYEVELFKRKKPLYRSAGIALYADRITVNEGGDDPVVIPFDSVSAVTVLGRNKLNVYTEKTVYQIRGGKRFNAVKYINFYYLHNNRKKDGNDGEFLGL
jgi:1-acyl-sn-glycerol-3-phosphate acyltransferase